MQLTPQAQAILLLTVNFGKADKGGAKPLSNGEWGRFAGWLRDNGLNPADLLSGAAQNLGRINDRTVTEERIQALLCRGAALGFALEKWERAGLWVLTRADQDYPERLKRRLRAASPPLLFGCGNKALLNKGGLAVVGSRNASPEDLAFTAGLGKKTASEGFSIISGGARGVDDAAMTGALEREGTGIAILADSLLRTSTSSRFRRPLISGYLALISPFNPEASFFAGNAMARNKYIYCLSDAAVVVSSTSGKGGTWSGAIEAIRNNWVPIWIKTTAEPGSGNPQLVDQGAHWLPESLGSIASLSISSDDATAGSQSDVANGGDRGITSVDSNWKEPHGETPLEPDQEQVATTKTSEAPIESATDSYENFVAALKSIQDLLPANAETISLKLGMPKADVTKLLKKGVELGALEKLTRPVRFRLAQQRPQQASFL